MNKDAIVKTIITHMICVIGILTITSCSLAEEQNNFVLPDVDIPGNNFNTKIVLQNFPEVPSTYIAGDYLAFGVINHSTDYIVFNNDFGIKLFKETGDSWEQIENDWEYQKGDLVLAPKRIDPTGLVLFVLPDLGDIDKLTIVRVVIIGEVEGKSEKVGAYIDVQYLP